MQIDITRILSNMTNTINVDEIVIIPEEQISDSRITSLENLKFVGNISLLESDELVLKGNLSGIMNLKDDITLEPVKYEFITEIEEDIERTTKIIDATDIMWQNIIVEIPSKVRATSEDIELSGDGWRVISEDTYNKERNNNNPFQNLSELLKKEDK